jgi:hypothetical protein
MGIQFTQKLHIRFRNAVTLRFTANRVSPGICIIGPFAVTEASAALIQNAIP